MVTLRFGRNTHLDDNCKLFFWGGAPQAQSQQKRAYLAGMQDAYEKVIKFMQSQQNIEVAACLARLSDYVRQELDAVDESIDADDVVMETKV